MITPRIVPVVSITGALGLIVSFILAVMVVQSNTAEDDRDCQRSVTYRDDQRTMWLYLVDRADPQQADEVGEFVTELNKRLPSLKCVDGNPVPKEN